MARIVRGEIRWANLNPVRSREQAGLRPVVIPEDGFGSWLLGTTR
jgi:mRNA-degrading endonuclease toxin of MazEF toxin-antitoxin module